MRYAGISLLNQCRSLPATILAASLLIVHLRTRTRQKLNGRWVSHCPSENREKCLAVGMNDFLSKPFTRVQVVQVIQRWVQGVT